jgi:hypothetical protein
MASNSKTVKALATCPLRIDCLNGWLKDWLIVWSLSIIWIDWIVVFLVVVLQNFIEMTTQHIAQNYKTRTLCTLYICLRLALDTVRSHGFAYSSQKLVICMECHLGVLFIRDFYIYQLWLPMPNNHFIVTMHWSQRHLLFVRYIKHRQQITT